MNNASLVLLLTLVLAGCADSVTDEKPVSHEPKAVESLLTVKDMDECGQSSGIASLKSASDAYVLSADSIDKVRACALGREKQRMPLLADLIDKYDLMLRQGNIECSRDIGTRYGDICMRKSQNDAAEWFNLAASQRLHSAMPNQILNQTQEQTQAAKPD